jgi:hypothetical protein
MSGELIENKPAYLTDPSIEYDNADLKRHMRPPRIKIIQSQSKPPFKPPFKTGDVIVIPQMIKIADHEEAFTFVPIHFFPSYVCINPYELAGQVPTIRDFSMDPKSPLARKCETFAKEKYPDTDYLLQFRKTLNFMIVVENQPEIEGLVHMFFSSGSFIRGQDFMGFIEKRKAPRYACRFRAVTDEHSGKKGVWESLVIMNAPEPWVEQEKFFEYKTLYEEIKELVDSRTFELDLSDVESESTDSTTEF